MPTKKFKKIVKRAGIKSLPVLCNRYSTKSKVSLLKDGWLHFKAIATMVDDNHVNVTLKLHDYVISTFATKGYNIVSSSDGSLFIELDDP